MIYALENFHSMRDEVYNVGSNDMNFSKEDIALMIKQRIDYYLHFAEIGKDEDQRNYEVSYEKINKAGFHTTIGIDEERRWLSGRVKASLLRVEPVFWGVTLSRFWKEKGPESSSPESEISTC
jgi:nucleoside-diphosphate-sugar epimerase